MPVDPSRRALVAEEYRHAVWQDATVQTRRTMAREWESGTLLANAVDAQALADADGGFHGRDIRPYRFRVHRKQFAIRPGMTIALPASDLLPAGAELFVTSVVEVVADGARYTEVTGWA